MHTSVTYHLGSMLTLGVDTSESLGGVALYDGERLAETRKMTTPLSHAECLFPLIESILEACEIKKDQIDLISINRGPGSFTGLRIGLAAAKGLCQSLGIPLVGVEGTQVYRHGVEDVQRVCVLIASRRDLFYARWFAGLRPSGPTEILREAELLARLSREKRELCLVGSGVPRIEKQLQPWRHIRFAPDERNEPSPLAVAEYGMRNYVADQLYSVEPLYVEPLLIGGKVA
jgi:tRNA threonylcarbamoyladenosine biosynthesis protein TsaB